MILWLQTYKDASTASILRNRAVQVKGLEPNSWHVFRVAAASDAGPSEWSHTASYCTATAPPSACPPPSATAAGFGALQVQLDTISKMLM